MTRIHPVAERMVAAALGLVEAGGIRVALVEGDADPVDAPGVARAGTRQGALAALAARC